MWKATVLANYENWTEYTYEIQAETFEMLWATVHSTIESDQDATSFVVTFARPRKITLKEARRRKK